MNRLLDDGVFAGLGEVHRRLLDLLAAGLPLTPRPYRDLAATLGVSEDEVIDGVAALRELGVIKRFGVVVRHHELGYRANAMAVWDIPDDEVATVAERLRAFPFVTLCYRRPRRPPVWPYNLFCMIHGRDRARVEGQVGTLIDVCGLDGYGHAVLFSRRRFKQRGARYARAAEPVA